MDDPFSPRIFLEERRSAGHFSLVLAFLAAAILAYLIGSFPSGYIAGRIRGVDLRAAGSGNIGATNALRVLGKKWGYAVFAADAFKGALAVLAGLAVARIPQFQGQAPVHVGVIAALFAIVGHSFPVWLGFKGGKGIATSAGIMFVLFPGAVFASGLAVWLGLFFATRFVSVASLGSAVTLPTVSVLLAVYGDPDSWFFGRCDPMLAGISAVMSGLAIWRHKDNIKRLCAGTEKRFDRKGDGAG
ncbi:MAG: glycerol-3-phosphate 1-O-acyltransferase PlsY [Terrimicrobiaceae bacterium]